MRTWCAGVCAVAAALAAAPAQAVEVKLRVSETAAVARTAGIVTAGVPFAKGAVKDVAKLSVASGGKPIPAQFAVTSRWDDGSVRWALMDVQADVPAGGTAELVVSDTGARPVPAVAAAIQDGADAVTLSSGPLQCVVSKKPFNLIQSLKVDGKELVNATGRGLVVYKEGGGEVVAGPPTEVKIEQAGPIRAVVCLRGVFPGIHKELLGYAVRISAFAGQKYLKVHVWLENHGAMGYYTAKDESAVSPNAEWLYFKGMAVELGLGLGAAVSASCEGAAATGDLKVLQVVKQSQSKDRNYHGPIYTWNDFAYTVTSGGKELKTGDRTDGLVALAGPGGRLNAGIRNFWENYEKAIGLNGKTLRLWLWPTEGVWPRPFERLHDYSFFDKTIQAMAKNNLYVLPGSVEKGHELMLDFSGRDAKATSADLSAPLTALAAPDYYASTEAAPGFLAPPGVKTDNADCDAKLAAWDRMARSAADPANPTSLFHARRSAAMSNVGYMQDMTYWYGWMDFGDLAVPGHGPVGLHYDWTWVMLQNTMRTGDPNFLRLATEMARHRIDVDQFWSDRDPANVNGLQRGDFGFPCYHCYRLYHQPDVSTNWLEGVVLYYMLTGEPKALECAQRNGAGLKAAWAWIAQKRPYAGPQGDMAANAWSMASYCALYDLTADKQWLSEALGLFQKNVVPKWKQLGPHLHDPANQIQSQDYVQDDMKYCYALESFCELHRRTQDATLFQLLQEGAAKEFPDFFFEAPLFLADLYAYVGYVTRNKALTDRAPDLFAQSFPESKSPPVYLPDNSIWSRTAAVTLRTGYVMQYCRWKEKK